jgi:hypothetical protein
MDHASIINFLSNEDTQELAPGFFIERPGPYPAPLNLRFTLAPENSPPLKMLYPDFWIEVWTKSPLTWGRV